MPLAKVGLARAYVMAGDKAAPGLPIRISWRCGRMLIRMFRVLRQVKAEYAKLQ